jgi:hypothetical protein
VHDRVQQLSGCKLCARATSELKIPQRDDAIFPDGFQKLAMFATRQIAAFWGWAAPRCVYAPCRLPLAVDELRNPRHEPIFVGSDVERPDAAGR